MAAPNLAITLTVNSTCSDMTITDSTSDYGGGTITTASVTGVVIVVTLSGGTYLTYTFTVASNVITAATLGVSGATPASILSELEVALWPFWNGVGGELPFKIWRDYGITVPEFEDGVIDVTYTITGSGYSYTTSAATTVPCVSTYCCVAKMGQAIDPSCQCEDCMWKFIKDYAHLTLANMSTNIGNTDRAAKHLTKASELCDCSDC